MRRAHGFTLIEVLIYTALVGLIMTSMVLLAQTAFVIRSHLGASLVLDENVRSALGRVTWLVGEASDITLPAPGATTGTLSLSMSDPANDPTTISVSDGVLTITQGTGDTQDLTSDEIDVSAFTVTRTSSTAPMVRLILTAGLRSADATYPTITVTTTASVRR